MGKRESPQTQVRRRVRDTSQAKLDGVNDLMDHNLTKVVLLLFNRVCQYTAAISKREVTYVFLFSIFGDGTSIAFFFSF